MIKLDLNKDEQVELELVVVQGAVQVLHRHGAQSPVHVAPVEQFNGGVHLEGRPVGEQVVELAGGLAVAPQQGAVGDHGQHLGEETPNFVAETPQETLVIRRQRGGVQTATQTQQMVQVRVAGL